MSETVSDVEPLASLVGGTRSFSGDRKVRLGDANPDGRLRLDALTRYTQDVSDDDTGDAGLDPEPGWVVRSTVVDELVPATLAEELTITTFCSGLGKRWAERRLTVVGSGGARYEVATLWICIDPLSGAPTPLTGQFTEIYGSAADGRKVSARLRNPKPIEGNVERDVEWQLRAVDYDIYGHVNNAAYWAVVEEHLPPVDGSARRCRLEYGEGIGPGASIAVRLGVEHGRRLVWWLEPGAGRPMASASVERLPPGLYRPTDGPLRSTS